MSVMIFQDDKELEGRILSYEQQVKVILDNGCVLFERDEEVWTKDIILDIANDINFKAGCRHKVIAYGDEMDCFLVRYESIKNDLGKEWKRLYFSVPLSGGVRNDLI
jgi:hypothetical protein